MVELPFCMYELLKVALTRFYWSFVMYCLQKTAVYCNSIVTNSWFVKIEFCCLRMESYLSEYFFSCTTIEPLPLSVHIVISFVLFCCFLSFWKSYCTLTRICYISILACMRKRFLFNLQYKMTVTWFFSFYLQWSEGEPCTTEVIWKNKQTNQTKKQPF